MYLLTETLSDTIVTYIVLKRLVKNWNEWDAFKVGIIDDKGNKLKHPVTSEERAAWTILDRFVYNVKRILNKFIGQSKLAFLLTTAYLLKDSINFYYEQNKEILKEDLNNFNLEKQIKIHKLLKEIDNLYIVNESINNIELNSYKHYQEIDKILENNNIKTIEDLL